MIHAIGIAHVSKKMDSKLQPRRRGTGGLYADPIYERSFSSQPNTGGVVFVFFGGKGGGED